MDNINQNNKKTIIEVNEDNFAEKVVEASKLNLLLISGHLGVHLVANGSNYRRSCSKTI